MAFPLVSDTHDCRSCYKCIRVCPTKSISFQEGRARIVPDGCILCGACYLACPQEAKKVRDDKAKALSLIQEGNAYCSLAPSYLSAFPGTGYPALREALLSIGFKDVEETAVGATIVKRLYDQETEKGERDVIISTCCHSICLLVEKHYPELLDCLAPYLSPMLAHAKDLKERHKEAKVIFIGPCISKKDEADTYGIVDCVLTFEELKDIFTERNIHPTPKMEEKVPEESKARLFPTDGGILGTMEKSSQNYVYFPVSGTEEAIAALESIKRGEIHKTFIELSACRGSCINGPALGDNSASFRAFLDTVRSAGKKDFEAKVYKGEEIAKKFTPNRVFEAIPSDEEIAQVLRKIGKTKKSDELNCGSCGYSTCREKAMAVIRGKASLEMCLPYLMEKARSFSNNIVKSSQNGIIVCNEDFSIQLINPAMGKILGLRDPSTLIGSSVSTILPPESYAIALGGTPLVNKPEYLADYGKYLETTITYDPQYHILIGVYRDVTEARERRLNEERKAAETVDIADQVVAKNMKAVQEIALLLGESAAETKVALNRLKDALKKDASDE